MIIKSYKISGIIFFFLLLISVNQTFGQEHLKKNENSEQHSEVKTVFNNIQNSVAQGDVDQLSGYLSSQTYLSLLNGINGYYSSNQAYYVLEDFFREYHVIDFSFDNVQSEEINVYATGTYKYVLRGKRDTAQVYVSLKHAMKKWKITQLTIN